MTEEEAKEYTNKLLERHIIQARPLTQADCNEIKKWIRIVEIFPNGTRRYMPDFKEFVKRYSYILGEDTALLRKLQNEVSKELEVEPVNDKDFEYVANQVIETISKQKINENL